MTDSPSRRYGARQARGLRRLEVWLPEQRLWQLDEICRRGGYSRPEMIEQMIVSDFATLPDDTCSGCGLGGAPHPPSRCVATRRVVRSSRREAKYGRKCNAIDHVGKDGAS